MRAFTTLLTLIAISAVSANTLPQVGKRLIQLGENSKPVWLTDNQVFDLIRDKKHFFDITDHQNKASYQRSERIATNYPIKVSYPNVVNSAKSKIDKVAMSNFLTSFSSIHTRFYNTTYGVQASEFLLEQVKDAAAGYTGSFTAKLFKHNWAQSSVIARIEGSEINSEVVVIGAHLDSINVKDPVNGRAPGADDDGSGTTTVLEILRVLAKSNFKPRRSIEFQFYSAEEIGLRGSQDVAQEYAAKGVNVYGMLHFDMTGYNEKRRVKVYTDNTDPELTQFSRLLIDNYSTFSQFNGTCGYACSDHASFNKAGYKSTHFGEDVVNRHLHTPQDTTQYINYDNIAEFAGLGLGFAIELAEPTTQ